MTTIRGVVMGTLVLPAVLTMACTQAPPPPAPAPECPEVTPASSAWSTMTKLDERRPIPLLPGMILTHKGNMRDHLLVVQEITIALAQDGRRDVAGLLPGEQGLEEADRVEPRVLLPQPELADVGSLAPAFHLHERPEVAQGPAPRRGIDRRRRLGECGLPEALEPQVVRVGLREAHGGHRRPGGRHERDLPAPLGRITGRPHAGIVRPVIAFRHRAGQAAGIERPGAAFRIDDQAREIASFALGRPVPDGG